VLQFRHAVRTVMSGSGKTREDIDMGDTGKKDKGKREQQKKAKLTPKEKKQQKRVKKT